MNPQILSLMGIFLALILVVAGSLRGISIIILSSVAAFLVAATGGIGLLDGYGAYLEGVAGSVTSMFPLFLGGQLLGCFLEKSGLTEAIANAVIHRSGTRGIVVAVFTVSWLLTFCGINVFVIIFTVYPIACAFFKVGDIPRSLIPACVLGACVSQQMLPGIGRHHQHSGHRGLRRHRCGRSCHRYLPVGVFVRGQCRLSPPGSQKGPGAGRTLPAAPR